MIPSALKNSVAQLAAAYLGALLAGDGLLAAAGAPQPWTVPVGAALAALVVGLILAANATALETVATTAHSHARRANRARCEQ